MTTSAGSRFAGRMEDTIFLTRQEVDSPDRAAIVAEKRRLIDSGVSPLDIRDLSEYRKSHPTAPAQTSHAA